MGHCGIVVLKSLLVIALGQELVPMDDERASRKTLESMTGRAYLSAVRSENDDYDQRVFSFQRANCIFRPRSDKVKDHEIDTPENFLATWRLDSTSNDFG